MDVREIRRKYGIDEAIESVENEAHKKEANVKLKRRADITYHMLKSAIFRFCSHL